MGGRTSSGSRWTESRESRSPSNRRGIVSVAAPLAQWIEHLPSKQRVGGSNPSRGAIFVSSVRFCAQIHVIRALGSRGRRRGSQRSRPWTYRPSLDQVRADAKARRRKTAKLSTQLELRRLVQAKLLLKLSPKQIAVELRQELHRQVEMQVSHETIYQPIYVQGRGALRRELAAHLRTGRALRKPRRRANERRGRIPDMVNISQRPAEVEDRAVPGHWEGDLLMGRNNKSAIGTLVERSTRFVMLLHLPNGPSASQVEQSIVAATQKLPEFIWKSLTWDQGSEMRNHLRVQVASGLQVYFCGA